MGASDLLRVGGGKGWEPSDMALVPWQCVTGLERRPAQPERDCLIHLEAPSSPGPGKSMFPLFQPIRLMWRCIRAQNHLPPLVVYQWCPNLPSTEIFLRFIYSLCTVDLHLHPCTGHLKHTILITKLLIPCPIFLSLSCYSSVSSAFLLVVQVYCPEVALSHFRLLHAT